MSHDPSTLGLIAVLEQQTALLDELGRLAERQGPMIDAGDTDALLSLLAQRQQIMDRFIASQDRMTQLSGQCRARPGEVNDVQRRRICELVDRVGERLAAIMRLDETDRARLERDRHRVGEALAGLTTARAARDAYARGRAVTNRFADQRG